MKRRLRRAEHGRRGHRFAAGTLLAALLAAAPGLGADDGRAKRFNVGFRILKVARGRRRPMAVALWYPTEAAPAATQYVQVGGALPTELARDAAPAKGRLPLVIFSHGGGGCATNGAVFAEELAARGFVVAGPDHDDEFTACRSDGSLAPDLKRAGQWLRWARSVSAGRKRVRFQHRPREIRQTLDAVLSASAGTGELAGLVDPRRIGMTGVSFGAWTTLAVGGSIPLYRDGRVKAIAPIAGPAGPAASPQRTANVRVPILLIFGEAETAALGDPASGRKTATLLRQYEAARAPKVLIGITGARHLDFGGAGTSNRTALPGRRVTTAKVRATDPVISTTNAYLLAFFRRYLNGDATAGKRLERKAKQVFLFRRDLAK